MRICTRAGLITVGAFILVFPASGVKAIGGDVLALSGGVIRPDPTPTPPPAPPPEPEEMLEWDEVLRNLLHYICAVIKCQEEHAASDSEVAAFIAAFHAHGVDPDLTPGQRAAALSVVIGAIDHTAADPGVLPTAQRGELLDVLEQIASALGS